VKWVTDERVSECVNIQPGLGGAQWKASRTTHSQQASRSDSPDRGKLRVFISYSRDDLKFADQLDAALNACGFECIIDRQGISGGEAWKRRLGTLISEADTVVFVLSPSSARSEVCAWEVEEAVRLNKRILPVICQPLEGASPPPQLRERNYIFFYEDPKAPGSGFGTGLAKLVAALNTDFDWLREHTRYLQRATEWDRGGRPANRLLSGDDIAEAKAWAARRPKSAPEPTALHLDFIRASEEEAEVRSNAQHKQLEAMAAAQAEREKALHEAEEAQVKQVTIRNIAFVLVTIFAVLATALALRSDLAQKLTEMRVADPRPYAEVPPLVELDKQLVELDKQMAHALNERAWRALFTREFTKALAVADRAHAFLPDDLTIETNRAHALMFLEREKEARALYFAHKGKPLSEENGKLWERAIVEDFAEFRKAGLTHPMMADIEKELGVSR
jgi:TIR domain